MAPLNGTNSATFLAGVLPLLLRFSSGSASIVRRELSSILDEHAISKYAGLVVRMERIKLSHHTYFIHLTVVCSVALDIVYMRRGVKCTVQTRGVRQGKKILELGVE